MATLRDIDRTIAIKEADLVGQQVDDSIIWVEDPVGFKEFCESVTHLNLSPLNDAQYEDIETLIGKDPKKVFHPNRTNDIFIMIYGKGGGKGVTAARLFLYIVYLLQCMAHPQQFLLGVKEQPNLILINVAKKEKQAERVFFGYFKNFLLLAPWFRTHFDIKDESIWKSRVVKKSHYRGKINITVDSVTFPKNVQCITETTENESWEGYNVVLFLLDEISGFTSAAELTKANAMFNTARSSAASRVTKNFRGLGLITSYPRQDEGDVALELLKQSYVLDRVAGILRYPWLSKGLHNYCGETFVLKHPRLDSFFGIEGVGVEIPIEYKPEFDINTEDSITKYLCIPPKTAGGWLEYPDRLMNLITPRDTNHPKFRQPLFATEDYLIDTIDEDGKRVRFLSKRMISCRAKGQIERYKIPRVAWLDAANKYCDAVIGIGHLETKVIQTDSGPVPMDIIVEDDQLIWRPDMERGVQVSIANIEKWLTTIIPANVRLVAVGADQWNSATLEEKLRKQNIKVEIYNLKLIDYNLLKRQIYLGAYSFLAESESPGQLVNLINGGPKQAPQKKPGFLKDCADTSCGINRLLVGRDKKGRKSKGRQQSVNRMPVGITGGGSLVPVPMDQVGNKPVGGKGIRDIQIPSTAARLEELQPQYRPSIPNRNLPGGVKV